MGNQYEMIKGTLEVLEKNLWDDTRPVEEVMTASGIKIKEVPYGMRNTVLEDSSDWESFTPGGVWGEPDTHYCFHVVVDIPEDYFEKEVVLFLSTGAEDIWNTNNPQMLVYIDGKRRCGMDMNHNLVTLIEKDDWDGKYSRQVDVRIYAYSNLDKNENYLDMRIAGRNEEAQQIYFDMLVPFEAAEEMKLKEDSANRELIYRELEEASQMLSKDGVTEKESCLNASRYLREHLYGIGKSPATVCSVGHTHIDVAWKWQLRQTREKVIRSYSTVMELMKKYPDYKFMASTPQMYEFVRQQEPELFDEILARAKEKRFEAEGAMWLEADCNLTSGESLVRQILYGKKYFKNTFGIESTILWLPDVFGYSAAMPQILKKSGIKAFMTTKLAWNDTNRMPHDLFYWEGIDGSSIPTYIITTCDNDKALEAAESGGILNYTYNGRQNAAQVMGTWTAFREKAITDEVLTCYGFGDGGGGPTWEMLEMDRRLRLGIPGVPVTKQTSVKDFFDNLLGKIAGREDLPIWKDELYLEFHRGTYTSIGKNKKNNRRSEYRLGQAELLSVWAYILEKRKYPKEELLKLWEIVMLNQFHDILPGSSIEEVYQDSDIQYREVEDKAQEIIADAETVIKKHLPENSDSVRDNYATLTYKKQGRNIQVVTDFYEILIDENGEFVSLIDRERATEIRSSDESPLNRLIAFEDKPKEYDCWNIDADFENVSWNITNVRDIKCVATEANGRESECTDIDELLAKEISICVTRDFRNSVIKQNIVIYADSRRIDFKTSIDWHEHQILLKAAFPVDIDAEVINCEIQYGNLERKLKRENSWDKAKFECCAHKWIDMSDKGKDLGVAILNDCKYGYDAKPGLMRLTLIKSGIFPNPNADQGIHEFTYALYPHSGDYRSGKVIEEARKLNEESHGATSFARLAAKILALNEAGIFIDAVKMAEDSEDIILRMYEGYGVAHSCRAKLFEGLEITAQKVWECDLMENINFQMQLLENGREIAMSFAPFEIKTLRIRL